MHWVDRGPEPEGLEPIRARYTPRWVEHYRNKSGNKPSDAYWRDFHGNLRDAFFSLCAYCEETCKGEIEHFRPKSEFPELVYEWSNWVFACHDCNHSKGEKWPPGGYVDPCARSLSARPENFFGFDTRTGVIRPKQGLSSARRKKAIQVIADLGLNAPHHLKSRRSWLLAITRALSSEADDDPDQADFIRIIVSSSNPFSSITRAFLAQRGYSF